MDHEFSSGATFDQHRYIPFIYSSVTDFLHVSILIAPSALVAGDEADVLELDLRLRLPEPDARGARWTLPHGTLELQGEYAMASADTDELILSDDSAHSIAESQQGFYAQAGFHFLNGAIKRFPRIGLDRDRTLRLGRLRPRSRRR